MEIIDDSINEDISGDPVYANNKLGHIQEGLTFLIRGTTHANGERFIVDFCLENSSKDIALRMASIMNRNIIGRNSRIKGYWSTEETQAEIPFTLHTGSEFLLQILFTVDAFLIAIDGFHVAKYQHRLPFHDIRAIEIRGDVEDIHVERKIVTDYPQRAEKSKHFVHISNRHAETGIYDPADYDYYEDYEDEDNEKDVERSLPLPYFASFPRGFLEYGYSMAVTGRIRPKAKAFRLSLQVGQHIWPQPTVALLLEFHFNARSDGETGEPIVSRNSFANGRWSGENKSELSTGLRPGAAFHLMLVRGKKAFEIYINRKPIMVYPYKVNPKNVDTLVVAGDIKLFDIEIEEGD
ncbi:32 kDa beta-galactoside-binding lectin lec-3-like isoform X2 [Haematobia irritans]|uniref:32 kDa beta-galactoside-binding lectin lec-3-like isoform X2 n=1 Tax=Haematobia irritans TaxID=7368 RepID=UPI003F4FC200